MALSTMKKELSLQLPSNYVDIDKEEMEYLDGGQFYSKSQATGILSYVGINPSTYILSAMTYAVATKMIKRVAALYGGVAGWALGTVLGAAASQIITFGKALCRGAINKGVDITWNNNAFKGSLGVNYTVRY